MENIVFLELRRKYKENEDIFYYVTKDNKEIDFADFLNFLLALAEDIVFELKTRAKNRTELPIEVF
jgi:predicted AAA+ superfamily ATPase